jgi:LDH2 family malate/lactate/ureidoglycolate dehydrogenase
MNIKWSFGEIIEQETCVMQAILWSQLRGNSQGVIKIPSGAFAQSAGAGPATVVHDSPALASLDGKQCLGMLALDRATKLAIDKAAQGGIGIVGINNTSSTTGALG